MQPLKADGWKTACVISSFSIYFNIQLPFGIIMHVKKTSISLWVLCCLIVVISRFDVYAILGGFNVCEVIQYWRFIQLCFWSQVRLNVGLLTLDAAQHHINSWLSEIAVNFIAQFQGHGGVCLASTSWHESNLVHTLSLVLHGIQDHCKVRAAPWKLNEHYQYFVEPDQLQPMGRSD